MTCNVCLSIENLRTLGGSRRLTKHRVGWHYRNQNMLSAEVLYKYKNYGHPQESPLTTYFNISHKVMNTSHVELERQNDCSHRDKLIKEVRLSLYDLPAILQNKNTREKFKH